MQQGAGLVLLAACIAACAISSLALAQQTNAQQAVASPSPSPSDWARDAAENERKIVRYNTPYLRYRIHKIDAKGDQIRDVIESKDGTVARLIASAGKPLTSQQDAAERSRLQEMINSPQAFAKHIKSDVSGKNTAVDLLAMMPQAMIYSYAPGQPQRSDLKAGPGALQEVVLDFEPNPAWKPPTLTSEALTGLAGRIWIDPRTRVVMRIEGRLVQPVNFGWGMLVHVYPGGTVMVEQTELPAHRFLISRFVENVTLRAMLVKTVKAHADITTYAFTPINPLTYQQAIETLLATPLQTSD